MSDDGWMDKTSGFQIQCQGVINLIKYFNQLTSLVYVYIVICTYLSLLSYLNDHHYMLKMSRK